MGHPEKTWTKKKPKVEQANSKKRKLAIELDENDSDTSKRRKGIWASIKSRFWRGEEQDNTPAKSFTVATTGSAILDNAPLGNEVVLSSNAVVPARRDAPSPNGLVGSPASLKVNPAPSEPDACFWPRDLLPQMVKNARVVTYGYDSSTWKGWFVPQSQSQVYDHATKFLSVLERLRSEETGGNPTRPLIFVAHSLGGIVVKEVLRMSESRKSKTKAGERAIFENTQGVVFMGTPHLGSDFGQLGAYAANLAFAVGQNVNDGILNALAPKSEILRIANEAFSEFLKDDKIRATCFYETEGMPGPYTRGKLVSRYWDLLLLKT